LYWVAKPFAVVLEPTPLKVCVDHVPLEESLTAVGAVLLSTARKPNVTAPSLTLLTELVWEGVDELAPVPNLVPALPNPAVALGNPET
jgi:hypothetical protein